MRSIVVLFAVGAPLAGRAEPPLGSRARNAVAARRLQSAPVLCDIGGMFAGLSQIKLDADCQAGCAEGTGVCPPDWIPASADACSAACGRVFEPFWDRCGTMLTNAGLGGMDEMGAFCEFSPSCSCFSFSSSLTSARRSQMTDASNLSTRLEAAARTATRTRTTATAPR